MRRLLSLAAFGFGFYYLWYNTDPTTEMLANWRNGFCATARVHRRRLIDFYLAPRFARPPGKAKAPP